MISRKLPAADERNSTGAPGLGKLDMSLTSACPAGLGKACQKDLFKTKQGANGIPKQTVFPLRPNVKRGLYVAVKY